MSRGTGSGDGPWPRGGQRIVEALHFAEPHATAARTHPPLRAPLPGGHVPPRPAQPLLTSGAAAVGRRQGGSSSCKGKR